MRYNKHTSADIFKAQIHLIVFITENTQLYNLICDILHIFFSITVADTEKNKHPVGDVCEITAWGAKVRTLVIATDEELMIARDTKEVIEK